MYYVEMSFSIHIHRCSYCVEAKIHSLRSCIFASRIVSLRKIELAQFTFFRFTKLISHISFTIFVCELRFLDYRYFAIAQSLVL